MGDNWWDEGTFSRSHRCCHRTNHFLGFQAQAFTWSSKHFCCFPSPNYNMIIWQVEVCRDYTGKVSWNDMDEDWGKALTESYKQTNAGIIKFGWELQLLKDSDDKTWCEYTVDFQSMTQLNHTTEKCRQIRQVEVHQ